MSKNKKKGDQAQTIPQSAIVPQVSFNLEEQDKFIISHGVQFEHYKAIPSPIGLKDIGDMRRPDELDTTSTNGFLYKCAGELTAVMLSNGKNRQEMDGGIMDASQSRLTLPRFYNKGEEFAKGKRIYLSIGDKVYIKDKTIDTRVVNFQRMQYESDRDNVPQFPVCCVENLIDSKGNEYLEDIDFKITKDGNIRWIAGARNPGIDPDTGKGRVYSIRYLYDAHWYVVNILNEVRIGNTTKGSVRSEERMPYQVVIVREYVYHNRNKGEQTKPIEKFTKIEDKNREIPNPRQDIKPNTPFIKVSMDDIDEEN